MIGSVVLLMVGSAIAGWATNSGMLIAGRAVQGVGSGGINMLVELIICDLVPRSGSSTSCPCISSPFSHPPLLVPASRYYPHL